MTEALTSFTDVLLFLSSVAFAIALATARERWRSRSAWISFFVALAVASGTGALYHATISAIGSRVSAAIWIVTMLAVAASLSLLETAILVAGEVRRLALAIPLLQAAVFIALMARSLDYRFVAVLSGFTIAVCLATIAFTPLRRTSQGAILIAGLLLSVVAAATQQSHLNVGPLDHNGLYHVLQLGANTLLFAASRRLRGNADAAARVQAGASTAREGSA